MSSILLARRIMLRLQIVCHFTANHNAFVICQFHIIMILINYNFFNFHIRAQICSPAPMLSVN